MMKILVYHFETQKTEVFNCELVNVLKDRITWSYRGETGFFVLDSTYEITIVSD